MQSVRWVTFCISNAVTRSIVHFFPASVNMAGPYSAQCKLTLFQKDNEPRSVSLEGARFGQPDGFRLDDVFPQLQEGASGFFGLEFEIATTQPRTDLSASSCVIELSSRGQSCRFWPRKYLQDSDTSVKAAVLPKPSLDRSMLALKDAFFSSSLVIVNNGAEVFSPKLLAAGQATPTGGELRNISVDLVTARGVVEIDLTDSATADVPALECSWGLVRAGGIWNAESLPEQVSMYALYRETVTRRPVSVVAL